jgi:hypothetical protein
MTRHHGAEAETVERRVLCEIDAHFASGADFRRKIANRCLDLVGARKAGPDLTSGRSGATRN